MSIAENIKNKVESLSMGKNLTFEQKESLANYLKKGLPTAKDEDWKYTPLAAMLQKDFGVASYEEKAITKEQIQSFIPNDLDASLFVFVDGFFNETLSDNKEEIQVERIANSASNPHYGKLADAKKCSLVSLNSVLVNSGSFIPISKTLNKPIYLLHISTRKESETIINYRNLFVLDMLTEATIIESYLSLNGGSSFSNTVTEIVVNEGAKLNYIKIQEGNASSVLVNTTQIQQNKNSLCNTFTYCLGGHIVRNDLNMVLTGQNCEAHLYGLYLTNQNEHCDNHTFVDHASPNCYSNELYKGIMGGKSNGVFNGKIMVREDAQKTNAFQSNKNILLSDEAKMNSKPQLEIFADDVKCSHGATTGQLDEEAIFYMQSRGIGKEEAKILLTQAFAMEVLEQIPIEEMRDFLAQKIRRKLSA